MTKINVIKNKAEMYVGTICLVGLLVFIFINTPSFSYELTKWVLIFSILGSIILVNHFAILFPLTQNSLSMDSAIFLASLFIFGLDMTLFVLLLASVINFIYQRQTVWWKHLFNFSNYVIMLVGAHGVFIFSKGEEGLFNSENILPYVLAMLVYSVINLAIFGGYFYMIGSPKFILTNIVKNTLSTYISTLILSIVCSVLIVYEQVFGLALFTIIVVLLSIAFKQYNELYENLTKKANTDELTGLYNHGYFKELLVNYIKDRKYYPLSLAILDIDDFKKYNDRLGHLEGDKLLKTFGSLLQERCGEDKIVSRYGGEEFVILMPNIEKDEALLFMDRLRKSANDTYIDGVELLPHGCLSFSGGIVEYEEGMYDSAEFLGRADQALYVAKAKGKNNVQLFHDEHASNHFEWEHELEQLEQQLRIFLSKDVNTYQHSRRVYGYAVDFCNKLELTDRERQLLIMGALVHDIGKLEIPRDIINKKGKLDSHEWEIMKKHVIWGKEIISTNKALHDLIPLVELHHERFDGKGYPYGLKGYSIPKLARILCIIDSFDAMTTERPYQKTKSFDEAIVELANCSGDQFDPEFVPLFIEMLKEKYPLHFRKSQYSH
ncbi:diguanylate cyclase [Bacillus sp. V5-8f]|uniref:diguanylate cyclase n=1 Tax=Bacillus sp. V5-8f TaxID=2053044 RepID=UPI000C773FA4|nr:diguanylate cyclase [Bacillus sp. V5-8f]PLT35220.1 HD family phosphohydrolase [Bacillus sp. V5-8f]